MTDKDAELMFWSIAAGAFIGTILARASMDIAGHFWKKWTGK
jgi:hypothetical protein